MQRIAVKSLIVLAGIAVGPGPISSQENALMVDVEAVVSAADTFALVVGGETVGTQITSLTREGDSFVFREETRTPRSEQTTVVRMSSALAMKTVHQRGTMAGQEMMIDVTYEAGEARGRARLPSPAGLEEVEVRSAVPEHVVDDNALIGLFPGMRLEVGTRIRVPVFQSGRNRLVEYVLSIEDAGVVAVPAGEYSARRVRARAGSSSIMFLVRAEAPHRVLAVEPPEGPLRIVRIGPG